MDEPPIPSRAFGGMPGLLLCSHGGVSCHGLRRLCGEHGSHLRTTDSLPQLRGDRSMATQAEGADVVQVALPAAFRHRQNVIGIPQTLAHPRVESPMAHQGRPCVAASSLQLAMLFDRVEAAMRADAAVSLQYLLAQITWLGSQLPFVDAVL